MDSKGNAKKDALRLRALSYNIHQGLTIHRKKLALSLLKEAILSLKADIVLLQEVAGTHRGKDNRNLVTPYQLEALADEIWPYHAYGRNAVFAGGYHGNAILSRYPIVRWDNIDISVKLAQRGLRMLPKRGMLHAVIELPGRDTQAHVMGTHFGLLQYERHEQLQRLCQHVKREVPPGAPLMIAGDFNDWREMITPKLSRTLKLDEAYLACHSRHARTFPARFPVLCLDRIYFRHLDLHSAQRLHGRPWQFLSDHLPLMADFWIKG